MSSEQVGEKARETVIRETVIDVRNEIITQSANVFLTARRALLASLGVVAMSMEEGNQFVDKLVERGEVAETEVQKMISDFRAQSHAREEKAKLERKSMTEKATQALEDSVDVILNRFNVPTKTDIEALSRKIGQLTEKITALKQQNGADS